MQGKYTDHTEKAIEDALSLNVTWKILKIFIMCLIQTLYVLKFLQSAIKAIALMGSFFSSRA